ncbi:MAG TPA: electron transfer flavoprotein subunit beta/FixA family protein [Syntrophorhabdaceae bacterium]|jgi:electron transfer flavoprotein beta subunit
MNLLVFTKRVPATQEEEVRIIDDGKGIDLAKIPFKVNDWDNYSVEEAVRIAEKTEGTVTAISMGDRESDEVLRRAIAMGAHNGSLLQLTEPLHDPSQRAAIACNFIKKENIPFDLIFTGVQSEDDQFAAMGGILAAKLDLPYVSMVIGIDEIEKEYVIVRRELEGGLQEKIRVSLPAILAIQSGINEPRYVSIMGVRKASKVERKVYEAEVYNDAPRLIEVERWVYPPKKGGARMLAGELDAVCKDLLGILKEKGVYQ